MFECEITVSGGSNSPSKDGPIKGPVSHFFRNYSKCYVAVKNHVVKCPKCCPEEALRKFLATRDKPSLNGFTSSGLLDMALKIEKGCEKVPGKVPPKAMVNTYLIRTGRPDAFIGFSERLDPVETVEALRWIWRQWEEDQKKSWMKGRSVLERWSRIYHLKGSSGELTASWLVRTIAEEFDASRPFPPLSDLEKLVTVAEVMYG